MRDNPALLILGRNFENCVQVHSKHKQIVIRNFRGKFHMCIISVFYVSSKRVLNVDDLLQSPSWDRLIKKSEVDVKQKKSASIYKSGKVTHSKEEKRKEVQLGCGLFLPLQPYRGIMMFCTTA